MSDDGSTVSTGSSGSGGLNDHWSNMRTVRLHPSIVFDDKNVINPSDEVEDTSRSRAVRLETSGNGCKTSYNVTVIGAERDPYNYVTIHDRVIAPLTSYLRDSQLPPHLKFDKVLLVCSDGLHKWAEGKLATDYADDDDRTDDNLGKFLAQLVEEYMGAANIGTAFGQHFVSGKFKKPPGMKVTSYFTFIQFALASAEKHTQVPGIPFPNSTQALKWTIRGMPAKTYQASFKKHIGDDDITWEKSLRWFKAEEEAEESSNKRSRQGDHRGNSKKSRGSYDRAPIYDRGASRAYVDDRRFDDHRSGRRANYHRRDDRRRGNDRRRVDDRRGDDRRRSDDRRRDDDRRRGDDRRRVDDRRGDDRRRSDNHRRDDGRRRVEGRRGDTRRSDDRRGGDRRREGNYFGGLDDDRSQGSSRSRSMSRSASRNGDELPEEQAYVAELESNRARGANDMFAGPGENRA